MSSAVSLDTLVVAGLIVSGAVFIFRDALFGGTASAAKGTNSLGGAGTGAGNIIQRKKRSRNFVEVMEQTVSGLWRTRGAYSRAELNCRRFRSRVSRQYALACAAPASAL